MTDHTQDAEPANVELEIEPTDQQTDQNPPEQTEDPATFPREYVVKLREEAVKHRTRAGDRDTLAHRLHAALVTAPGRLTDPTDLTDDEAHLDDEDALIAALDDLLTRRPHLASRRP